MDRYDLVIIGMGSGGMVGAEFAATIGLRVAVVERARVGGDCLWTGCVPSKALLASAKAAHTMRHADTYGITPVEPDVDTARVWQRIRAVQAEVASTDDDPARFEALGVEIVRGEARLAGAGAVTVTGGEDAEERILRSRFILVCTGSRPAVPEIEGLGEAGYLTSESLFELEHVPRSFVVVGGGPIAVEMAQAFARLGISTTLLQRGKRILARDEPDLADAVASRLRADGVDLRLEVSTERVTVEGDVKVLHGTEAGQPATWSAEELLVAVGRRPNVEGLGLEAAGVRVGRRGIEVDDRMRSSVPTIYACGDVAGRFLFTHSAGYEAVRAIRDAFYPGWGKVTDVVPWCTFTDPELAHVGLTVAEAEARHGGGVEVYRMSLAHSDRARADGAPEGMIVVVTVKGRVVGAHILAPGAGEIIHELVVAVAKGLRLSELASVIHVYPTISTTVGQLAGEASFEGAKRFRWLIRK